MGREVEKRISPADWNSSYSGPRIGTIYHRFRPTGMELLLRNVFPPGSIVRQRRGRNDRDFSERSLSNYQRKWLPAGQNHQQLYCPPTQ